MLLEFVILLLYIQNPLPMLPEKIPMKELKQKHVVLTLKQKMEVLSDWKTGENNMTIGFCKTFPHEIGRFM